MILQEGTNSSLKVSVPAEGRAKAYGAAIETNKAKIKTVGVSPSSRLSFRTVPLSLCLFEQPIVIREHLTQNPLSVKPVNAGQ